MFSKVIAVSLLSSLALAAPLTKRITTGKIYANDGTCLGLTGSTDFADGTPVGSVDCTSAGAISWVFSANQPTSFFPEGTNQYALDAGSDPENFGKLKLWTSYPGLTQQTWYYTNDNRIAIYNGNQCLDDGNGIQTYQCTTGNTNQIFNTGNGPTTSSSAPASSTPSASATSSAASEQFTSGGHYTITYIDCAPGGGGEGCEIQQPTPTAGDIVATVTLS